MDRSINRRNSFSNNIDNWFVGCLLFDFHLNALYDSTHILAHMALLSMLNLCQAKEVHETEAQVNYFTFFSSQSGSSRLLHARATEVVPFVVMENSITWLLLHCIGTRQVPRRVQSIAGKPTDLTGR